MTSTPSHLGAAAQQRALEQLLQGIDDSRRRRIDGIEARSAAEARAIVAEARSRARERIHHAVREERRRHVMELERQRAAFATRIRQRRYAALRSLVESAWMDLPALLEARFADPACQSRWMEAALALAGEKLPRQSWRVVHPASLSEAQRRELSDAIVTASAHRPVLEASSEIRSGLIVEVESARLDATPAGLLRDRKRIQSRLLGELLEEER